MSDPTATKPDNPMTFREFLQQRDTLTALAIYSWCIAGAVNIALHNEVTSLFSLAMVGSLGIYGVMRKRGAS